MHISEKSPIKKFRLPDGRAAVYLGSLELQVKFTIPGDNIVYETLTYPFSFVNITQGTRACTNTATLKSKPMANKTLVVPVVS
jgi:hypothetical protein